MNHSLLHLPERVEVLEILQNIAMKLADLVMAVIPRPVPNADVLAECKIISHRGEFDNIAVKENTLAAFRHASGHGVWGIECDIRWTSDLTPVVCHDADTGRVFGTCLILAETHFSDLREQLPQIPTLAEVVAEFGGNTHLMLEIKDDHYPHLQQQAQILEDTLAALEPAEDYHFLALEPDLFLRARHAPKSSCLPVAELNVKRLSRASLLENFCGLSGHYLLLGNSLLAKHNQQGQQIGTGFISSRNCLFRELNRGVQWIFSNDAVKVQKILDSYLQNADA
ncbi:MAG: glycerophosphodiester phosphodiesterase family protein [Halioglobus sp.]